MAAGDLLTADRQVEIRGVLTGAGTVYEIDYEGVTGLGTPAAKTADVDLGHAAGTYLGRDYMGPRILTVPYLLGGTDADAGTALRVLNGLWAPSETDIPLHLQVPGFGRIAVNGRPRGLLEDLVGYRALATFVCGDPTMMMQPTAPIIGTATAGVGQATANWAAPASNGGAAVVGYEVKTYRASDGVLLFTNTPAVVLTYTRTGLTAGVGVYFKVAAYNAWFSTPGPQSAASNTVTPT